ncbi:hypothetical protein GDO81_024539 [Engystomops pustulosus]|uniref:Uncharacterized protein n=1 Tax=Engystomops pustulosus TaxID=76066 RepID=A0AAV6Z844_ENGPU|nr:hypothetical protein GDO81_024539 [Engystomops pustulosus]
MVAMKTSPHFAKNDPSHISVRQSMKKLLASEDGKKFFFFFVHIRLIFENVLKHNKTYINLVSPRSHRTRE